MFTDTWHMFIDTWHMFTDTWHMFTDTWHMYRSVYRHVAFLLVSDDVAWAKQHLLPRAKDLFLAGNLTETDDPMMSWEVTNITQLYYNMANL